MHTYIEVYIEGSVHLHNVVKLSCRGTSDPEIQNLPTVRGGYDGFPIPSFLEISDENANDETLDGRLQGVIGKVRPVGNPMEIREKWSKFTEKDRIDVMEGVLDRLKLINQYTTES